jgi:hypothetical protein
MSQWKEGTFCLSNGLLETAHILGMEMETHSIILKEYINKTQFKTSCICYIYSSYFMVEIRPVFQNGETKLCIFRNVLLR